MGTDGAVVKSSMTAKSESVGTQPVWHLQMLGQFRAIRPDSPASEGVIIDRFQTQKTSLLLAILTHSSRPVSREDLVERLWPDAEPAAGRDRLSQALSWLRRRFESDAALPAGGVFGADRQSVWLLPGAFSTDVAAFDAGVRATRAPSGDTEQVASVIEAALALYAGPLLPGICEEDAVLFREQQRLAGAYEDALRRVVVLHENAGRFPNAVAHARRLLGLNPADEETCARLLRLFARTGEREAALRTVSSFTRRYRDAHGGNSPSNMLQQLAQAVRAREPAAPRAVAVAPMPVGGARLPLPLTRYFGRENERTFLLDRLQGRHSRLVSLLGPGGCGKTRFALELGRRFESDESGSGIRVERRAFFIPLEPVARARQIIPAVYRVIQQQDEAREDGTALRTMLARLLQECAEHPLLILDNCEHLAGDPEMLAVIADLLARVPSLSLLATSRRPLCLEGEQTFPLSPLATPPSSAESGSSTRSTPDELLEHYASVQMFVDRVCNVRLDFRLTRQNQSAVALLCARLEGLPLAIELCAAWAATLTPEQMLAELQDRFDLLASRRPDVPPRHHSMRAAIDTSYTLLPDDLRGSFAALSVFRGGWFTEAAQQIIGGDAVPSLRDQLARLQEHSLVIADTVRDPASDEGATRVRFRLLDTLREFAADQMTRDEKHALAERHAAHYLQLAENAAPHLTGHQQRRWMDVLEAEHNNLRAALTHYDASGNAASGLRLAVALRHFWNRRGYLREACEFLALFLGHFSASPAPEGDRMWQEATGRNALGRALRAAGNIAAGHHEQEIALELWQRLRHNRGIATTLLEIGIGTYLQGNAPEATLLIENSLKLAREANDLTTVAGAMMNLGNIAISQHELALARQYYQDCLPLARSEDSAWLLASTLNNLGEISRLQGDLAAATLFYEEALRGARVLDNRLSNVLPLLNLAEIARLTGDLTRSETLIHESLTLVRNLGDVYMTAQCLFAAAALANAAQKPERAATILGAVTALQSAMAAWLDVSGPEDQQRLADSLRATLGDTRFQIALAGGAAYPPDRIITFALSGESTL